MHLIINLVGNVTWDSTRTALVSSQHFALGSKDFGTGAAEPYAKCPGCGRELPTALMHLDHIFAQHTHTQRLLQAQEVKLLDQASPHHVSPKYTARLEGGTMTIFKMGEEHESRLGLDRGAKRSRNIELQTVVHTATAWQNDLENLQWLCMCCNTGKQDKPFEEKFPGRAARPFKP